MFNRNSMIAGLAMAGLAACGGGSGSSSGSAATGLGGNSTAIGTLAISITDAPVDGANKVVVKFTGVEIKPAGGNAVVYNFGTARSIDLLSLSGGATASLFDAQTVPAGNYEWVRLLVDAQQNVASSFIELKTGSQFPLFIPSGEETGLKLTRGFTVAAGGNTDLTVDFDLRKSIVAPPGQAANYLLKPALRIVDNLQTGTLSGTVPAQRIPSGCTPFIYVFSGSNVVPDDLDPAPAPDVDPLVSVPVTLNAATGAFSFKVPFLEAGNYTVAFTCDGAKDTSDGEETLVFSPAVNVTVNANQTVTLTP